MQIEIALTSQGNQLNMLRPAERNNEILHLDTEE
jgi:hypothetical protein